MPTARKRLTNFWGKGEEGVFDGRFLIPVSVSAMIVINKLINEMLFIVISQKRKILN